MESTPPSSRRAVLRVRAFLLLLVWTVMLVFVLTALQLLFDLTDDSITTTAFRGAVVGGWFVAGFSIFNALISRGRLRWFVKHEERTPTI